MRGLRALNRAACRSLMASLEGPCLPVYRVFDGAMMHVASLVDAPSKSPFTAAKWEGLFLWCQFLTMLKFGLLNPGNTWRKWPAN